MGYSLQGRRESDTTERLTLSLSLEHWLGTGQGSEAGIFMLFLEGSSWKGPLAKNHFLEDGNDAVTLQMRGKSGSRHQSNVSGIILLKNIHMKPGEASRSLSPHPYLYPIWSGPSVPFHHISILLHKTSYITSFSTALAIETTHPLLSGETDCDSTRQHPEMQNPKEKPRPLLWKLPKLVWKVKTGNKFGKLGRHNFF